MATAAARAQTLLADVEARCTLGHRFAEHAAVILAVVRDEHGQASIVAARGCEAGDPRFLGWLAACAGLGARELHAYRLAETRSERAEISADLGGPSAGVAAEVV